MALLNNTHYWHDTSRVYIETPDTNSFGYESNRRLSYYLRLYYEYLDCIRQNGQCFYITFTYNNKALPLLFGQPVFNYDHIRLITNGFISKRLNREYHAKLKYLCACESGDGKGQRGKGNNPHYHFIFYVLPLDSEFRQIDPNEFLAWCQELWQGKRGYYPWQFAKFGSVKQGKFGVVVNSPNALKYVSKYCLKDSVQKSAEEVISNEYAKLILKHEYSVAYFKRYYWYLKGKNTDLSISHFLRLFDAESFFKARFYSARKYTIKEYADSLQLISYYRKLILTDVQRAFSDYNHWFTTVVVPEYVSSMMNQFKNQYSGKMRCSKSLGLYGVSQVIDVDSKPHFVIFEQDSPKVYSLPLYFIRHLYYDVRLCPHTGNPLYILNQKGKKLKLCQLSQTVSNLYNNTLKNINTLTSNNLTYYYKSDLFNPCSYAVSLRLTQDFIRTVYKYAVYSVVYKNRCFCSSTPVALSSDFSFNEILEDYDYFLSMDQFKIDFEEASIKVLFAREPSTQLFSAHSCFKDYFTIFEFLDSVNDFIKSYKSDIKKREYNETAELQKRHNAYANS